MILQFEGTFGFVRLVLGDLTVDSTSQDFPAVVDDDAVPEHGLVGGLTSFPFLKRGAWNTMS